MNTASHNRLLTRRQLAVALAAGVGVLASGALTACGGTAGSSSAKAGSGATITVGSKDFTEGNILSELYALALEDAGFTVKRKFDIAGSVVHTAITSKQIDLYPEYTGTALINVLKLPAESDPQKVYETVKTQYKKKFDLDVLNEAEAADAQALVIATRAAEKYDIKTISDLQKHASELRFASQGDFDEREDSMPALEKAYGAFAWKDHKVYDNGLKWELLKNDKADVAPAYTTEGQLASKDFTLIEDDKHVWPPYNVIPVVRGSVLKDNPAIKDALNAVSAKLTTKELTKLNARVDIDKEDYEDVASDFFDQKIKD